VILGEAPVRDHLVIYLNGETMQIRGEDAFLTFAEFLRRRQGLTGTKVVCAEGDCGSCSVIVGRAGENRRMKYSAVTSCIQLMFQLDSAHVLTIEGLRGADRALNPLQESMVRCHGAQCGFCTPGFVVSLYDLKHQGESCDDHQIRRALVGNLCRCTGYDSIIRAAMETDCAGLKPLDALYPPDVMIDALTRAASEEVTIESGVKKFYKPVTLDQATKFRATNPACTIVAGATDLGVQQNKRLRELCVVMSTGGLTSLRAIEVKDHAIHVGATASLSELESATLEHLPELGRFLAWFGSPLIKNTGTLAGNLMNGSPIADTTPALLVLGAEIELISARGSRTVDVNDFYTGYRKTVLAPDEMVTRIRIPLPREGEILNLYKVSRRKDLDIATFGAAIFLRRAGRTIEDIRIAYGGVAPTVVRMRKTEAFLRGGPMSLERFAQAGEIAQAEVSPISDVRGSCEYRSILARNVLIKFWHEAIDGRDDDGTDGSERPRSPKAMTVG
jgi:xanthine dehydrogenase small subunit